MQDTYDPYSQWLSIPAGQRPPDYYQLLGLAPLESDLFRIIASADRQIGRVLPHLKGDRSEEARRLLDELLTAKGFLITPTAKAIYDAEFRKRLAESDLPEDAALLDLLSRAPPTPRASPATTPPPAPTSPVGPPPPSPAAAEAPPIVVPPSPPRDAIPAVARATLVAPPGAAFASAASGGGSSGVAMATAAPASTETAPPLAPMPPPPSQTATASDPATAAPRSLSEGHVESEHEAHDLPEAAPAQTSVELPDASPFAGRRLARDYAQRGSWAGPLVAFIIALAAVGGVAGFAWQRGFRLQIVSANGTTPPEQDGDPPDASPLPQPTPSSGPSSSSSQKTPESSHSLPEATPAPSSSHERPPTPKPPTPANGTRPVVEPMPAPNIVPAADREKESKLKESLSLARASLAARDVPAADKQLDAASGIASSPELAARVESTRLLRDYVDGFWNAVRQSAKTLKGGEELSVRGKVVVVVEARADEVVIRAAGENRAYKLRDLPPYLATALAERWLAADDVNSPVFVAAFWLVDPKADRDMARAKLAAARAAGAADAAKLAGLPDSP